MKDRLRQSNEKLNAFFYQKELENSSFRHMYSHADSQHKERAYEQNSMIFHSSVTMTDKERKKKLVLLWRKGTFHALGEVLFE